MTLFYKESRDYSYAQVLAQQGKTLAVWLTDCKGDRVFSLLKLDSGVVVDGNLEGGQDTHTNIRDFVTYCDRNDAVFLLPVSDEFLIVDAKENDLLKQSFDRANNMSDSIEILEAALAGSEKAVRDRDEEITSLKTTIKGFEAALELANEKVANRNREIRELSDLRDSNNSDNRQLLEERDREIAELRSQLEATEKLLELSTKDSLELRSKNMTANQALNNIAFQLGFQSFDNEQVAIAIESLLELRSQNNTDLFFLERKVKELSGVVEQNNEAFAKELRSALDLIKDRDRKIEILEDNLDRARSEHLEQLRAIVQMLQPLIGRPYNSTENKDGKTYVHVNYANDFTHAEKNAAIKLIQKVLYSNINKLDPCLKSSPYVDDF